MPLISVIAHFLMARITITITTDKDITVIVD
jgi:hypothetical protein